MNAKGFRLAAASGLLTLLTLAAAGFGAQAASRSIATYQFSYIDNRVFLKVAVDGRAPFSFLLDTGSSEITIDRGVQARLSLPSIGGGTTTGAGESAVDFQTVHLHSVKLGSLELGPVDAPVLDGAVLARTVGFRHFDGVIGASLFKGRVVTIDVSRAKLTVEDSAGYRPPPGAIAIPLDFNDDDMPIASGSVGGVSARLEIDTGDRSSLTLFGPFWRGNDMDHKLGLTTVAMTGYGVGGPIRSIVGRPGAFAIEDLELPSPVTRLSLQKAGAFTKGDNAGSIGMGVLQRFVVAFDYARRTMWLKASRDFAQPDRYDRSGAWLSLDDDTHLTVLDIVDGGPAARAGIQRGDRVLAVDGIAATPKTLFAIRALLRRPGQREVIFHLVRNGAPVVVLVALRDLISQPSDRLSTVGK